MQTDPSGAAAGTTADQRQLVAVYKTYDRARSARDDLTAAGIPAGDMDMLDAKQGGWAKEGEGDRRDEGFWGAIKRMFTSDETDTYAEGLRRGHAMLVVRPATADMHARAVDVLERTEPLDFDARVSQWRNEGWSGRYDDGATWSGRDDAAPMGAPTSSVASTKGVATGTAGALGTTGMAASAVPTEQTGTAPITGTGTSEAGEQRIPLAEEKLRVGKHEVGSGNVRVRSYVVERPVEEQVGLHQESVNVERRRVDRPASETDDPFRERTVEVTARSEEAVVGKETRVREEVVVRKDASDRIETVTDTVRRTEVEVDEDKAGQGTASGAAAVSGGEPAVPARGTPEKGTVKP